MEELNETFACDDPLGPKAWPRQQRHKGRGRSRPVTLNERRPCRIPACTRAAFSAFELAPDRFSRDRYSGGEHPMVTVCRS